ncbi:MAG: hypothetical protein ACK4N5_15065 [Myxococcales bacterium]
MCEDLLTNANNHLGTTFDNLCSIGGGKWSDDELCDHTGALGGCRCEGCSNGKTVMWFFAGAEVEGATLNTVDDVKAVCEKSKRPFVAP